VAGKWRARRIIKVIILSTVRGPRDVGVLPRWSVQCRLTRTERLIRDDEGKKRLRAKHDVLQKDEA
jgi:hypothetical protein